MMFTMLGLIYDCMTVVLAYLCCGCCATNHISLSTCSAAIVDDIKNDDQTLTSTLNDVSMASGDPSGNRDVIIDIIPPDLLTSDNETNFRNINEVKNVDTLVCTENLKDIRLEMPSCSRYCDNLSVEN